MREYHLTNKQARTFLLLKHGLLGDYRFEGKDGIMIFIQQAGCIQFDPIDVCGRNPDLVLFSRIKKYNKQMLYDLLYKERKLVDYFDKNLAIFPIVDWPYFERERARHRLNEYSKNEIAEVRQSIKSKIKQEGPLNSSNLDIHHKVNWYWNDTSLSRASLEHMYFTGELAIHHKKGTFKFYDLIEHCLPSHLLKQKEPHELEHDYFKWQVKRRIHSIGLLWNRASDAWLNIHSFKAKDRIDIFSELIEEEKIVKVIVENIQFPLYCDIQDIGLLDYTLTNPKLKKRCEFLAPLDNLMWDRKLIKAIFAFEYKWEIYTPIVDRKYGHYVLPILYGDNFIGRIEPIYDKKTKTLKVNNIWYEPHVHETAVIKSAIDKTVQRLLKFNNVDVTYVEHTCV